MHQNGDSKPARVLIIGPLPPPYGGSRVSFSLFLRRAQQLDHLRISHIDFPIRKVADESRLGAVSYTRSAARAVAALVRIPVCDRVVLFASRGTAFSFGLAVIAVGRLWRKPVVVRLFGGRPYAPIRNRWAPLRWVTDRILTWADGLSLETETGRNDFPIMVRDRVRAIRGYRPRVEPVSPGDSVPSRESGAPFKFVFGGRVDKSKGMDVLMAACSILSREHPLGSFQVDCYGPASEEVQAAAGRSPGFRLAGSIDNASYRRLLPGYGAFVYPSIYDNEGHPGALIEAMQAGLPVVSSALPTVGEIVRDGVEGLLIEPGDPDALAAAMGSIMTNPSLRAKLAQQSGRAGMEFDEDVVIPILLKEMGLSLGSA